MQNMQRQETVLRWVNSDQQLADGLTKMQAQDRIRQFLQNHQIWNLQYDANFTAAKKIKSSSTKSSSTEPHECGPTDPTWLDLVTKHRRVITGHVNLTASGTETHTSIYPSDVHSCQDDHPPTYLGSNPNHRSSFRQHRLQP